MRCEMSEHDRRAALKLADYQCDTMRLLLLREECGSGREKEGGGGVSCGGGG